MKDGWDEGRMAERRKERKKKGWKEGRKKEGRKEETS